MSSEKENIESIVAGLNPAMIVPTGSLVGKTIRETLGERSHEIRKPYIQKAMSGKTVYFEALLPNSPGLMQEVFATYTPHFDENKNVKEFVAHIFNNSERKLKTLSLETALSSPLAKPFSKAKLLSSLEPYLNRSKRF